MKTGFLNKERIISVFSSTGIRILLILFSISILTTLIFFIPLQNTEDIDPLSGFIPINLTDNEIKWISNHPVVSICPDKNYPPFEQISENGEYQGISADILREISSKTGLQITVSYENDWGTCVGRIKNGSADILGAVYISDLRDDYLIYSEPYYRSPLPIITRITGVSGITLEQLSGRRVASVSGFTTTLMLQRKYPEIFILEVPDVKTGLELVSLGTVDAYFGDLAVSTWYVEESGISNLKVAGIYEPENLQDFNYAFGVRKDYPELVSILNKGLHAIPPDKRGEIFRKWISPTLTRPAINQKTLIIIEGIIGLLIIITILFIIWNRTLKRIVDTKTQDLKAELAEHKKTADILQMTRFTVDHSHAMMLWFDKNGMIRDVNETICIKSGYQRHELIGSHISLLEKGLKQEELNTDITYIEKDGRRIRETTLRFHDGAVIPVLIMLWNFTFENDDWLYAEIEDISQKIEYEKSVRDSEEKYRGLFHHVNDAIILFGIDDTVPGMILDANEAAEIMTGYQHDELCLMPYVHLGIALHPSIRELDPPGCTSRRFTFEWEIITATAEIIPVEVNLHIFEQEGVKFGLSLIRDVTERKRFEIEREASINQIQKNLAELSLLNDGIRNPLSVILGTAEIYCEDGFPLIEKQVLRVDEMIRQLDQRWNESEKILNFLKKHHGIVIQKTEEQDGSLDH